jgi:hypothetical protein
VNPTPAAPVAESAWQVHREVNPVTGVTTITASLKYQGSRNIIVREIGKKLECYIETDEFLETLENMHTGISTVQYKFDDGKVGKDGRSAATTKPFSIQGIVRHFLPSCGKQNPSHSNTVRLTRSPQP